MRFQILATIFFVLAMLIIMITPTKFGIWSTYSVRRYPAAMTFFTQNFHAFGFEWSKEWYSTGPGEWFDDQGRVVHASRAAWLERLSSKPA